MALRNLLIEFNPTLWPLRPASQNPFAALQLRDTIVAISTPPGRGGLGVVRLSGNDARRIGGEILRGPLELQPWRAQLAELIDAQGHTVDQVVATFFEAPHSYTAEDLVEISCPIG